MRSAGLPGSTTGSLRRARDRLLASPRFRRWAAALPADPADRPAPRRARCSTSAPASSTRRCCWPASGCACSTSWRDGPQTAAELVARGWPCRRRPPSGCCAPPSSLACWSGAATAASGWGRWARRWSDNPGVAAMVEHHAHALRRPARPGGAAARRGRRDRARRATGPMPATARPGDLGRRSRSRAYTRADGGSQPLVAERGAGRLSAAPAPLPARRRRRRRHVPDRAPRPRAPHLRVDAVRSAGRWPSGRERVSPPPAWRAGPRPSAATSWRDPLPTGRDIVSLVRVIHDHDDAAALTILRAARRALPRRRHAADRRADGRHARRRAGRRRLFRLLPAGHGQRPAAHARRN